MPDPFKLPSQAAEDGDSDIVKFADLVGEVVLIKPTNYEQNIESKYDKPYDRVVADVVKLNVSSPDQSEAYDGMWITQGRVIAATKNNIGGMVLAKLSRPEPTKSNQNPAYELSDPSEAEVEAARKYLAGSGAPPF